MEERRSLLRLLLEESYKVVEVVNNAFQLRIVFLHDDRCKVRYLLGYDFGHLYIIVVTMLIFAKPSQEQTVAHGLTIVTSLTLVKKYLWILCEELFNDAEYGLAQLPVAG